MIKGIFNILPKEEDWQELKIRGAQSSISQMIVAILYYFVQSYNQKSHFILPLAMLMIFSFLRYFYSKLNNAVSFKNFAAYTGIVCMQALSWGYLLSLSIVFNNDQVLSRIIAYMFLTGVMSGAVQSLGTSLSLFMIYQLILLLPSHLRIFDIYFQHSQESIKEPIAVYMFLLFLLGQRQSQLKLWHLATNTAKDLKLIISNFPGAISLVRKGKYVHANSHVCDITGLNLNQIIDQAVGGHNPDSDIPKLIHELEIDKNKRSLVKEITFETINGPKEHIVFLNRLHNKDIIVVSLDVSQQKMIEKELAMQKVKTESSAKMAALGEMAAGVAHEINNPLAIIKVKSQIINKELTKDSSDKDFIFTQLSSISSTVDRIAKIVRGLKNFARDGEHDPFQTSDISSIINDTLSLCQARLDSKNIDLIKINTDSEVSIECRSVQISQVLLNLLNNAHDAVESLDKKWIKIELIEKNDIVQICVTDSGFGIPQSIREKLMQPFFTTKEIGKGTGLGLSLSRGLIESHKGRLFFDFDSAHTKVVIELPKQQNDNKQPIAS